MIIWGIEDDPVPEATLTVGSSEAWILPRPYGWPQAWRIVGWLLLAGALGAALGAWLVAERML